MIQAEAHSDDRNVEVSFDATDFFAKASDKDILDLARCGWRGDYPADEVALRTADTHQNLAFMFKYLEAIANDPAKKDCHGFECSVNEADACAWVRENRQHLVTEIEKTTA